MTSFIVNLEMLQFTDEQFYQFCQINPMLRLELTTQRELQIISKTHLTEQFKAAVLKDFNLWHESNPFGTLVSSSTVFELPNGALRSPEIAWIERSRWGGLIPTQQQTILPLAPDFIIEISSTPDEQDLLQTNMQEYMDNQVKLGWLFDMHHQRVEIYRSEQSHRILSLPAMLSGESVLPGFVFTALPIQP